MDRFQFELLTYLEREGKGCYSIRTLSDNLCISGSAVTDALTVLENQGLIARAADVLYITDAGLSALEPYRVKKAIIAGAGFGSRMMPATADRPKPMVTVNGVRIIDTLLDALVAVGIKDITIVGGYKFEKLKELLDKYPFLQFLNNTKYETENNISSAILAKDLFNGGCYFCEADLYITNPGIIKKYQYRTNILGSWSIETDDWCFKIVDGFIDDYKKGGNFCYNYYGISFWTDEDSKRLINDWVELYNGDGGKDLFWEFPALIYKKENYKVEIRPCNKQDIMEIDNYYELQQLDPSYK
ncbi:MAG: NTP transferase domain-containing protein [Lachnospiraceae bacterium]|nr:NTP transferase domain-containing protein [Candidatus Minthocola equi]